MAKPQKKTVEDENERNQSTPKRKPSEEGVDPPQGKKGLYQRYIGTMIDELIQNVLLGFLFFLGIRKQSSQMGGMGGQGGQQVEPERQTPDWLLSAFPNWTREDNDEYELWIESHPERLEARKAAEEFYENIRDDYRYDETKYRVYVVTRRREYMERLRRPAPKDESGGRLSFEPITLRDPTLSFLTALLEERNRGGSSEEIYERQREITLRRDLLPKKHLFRRAMENKLTTILVLISTVIFVGNLVYWILYLILG